MVEPEATFSTCFAAPFLPLHPTRCAAMLSERLRQQRTPVWLLNTGWTGGPYGVGQRIKLTHTRAMVHAILDGSLREVAFSPDSLFGVEVPASCPGVPAEVLKQRELEGSASVRRAARANLFRDNFKNCAPRKCPSQCVRRDHTCDPRLQGAVVGVDVSTGEVAAAMVKGECLIVHHSAFTPTHHFGGGRRPGCGRDR